MKLHWSPKSPYVRKVMIVAHEITNEANDQRQLQPMARAASRALGEPVTEWLDRGWRSEYRRRRAQVLL